MIAPRENRSLAIQRHRSGRTLNGDRSVSAAAITSAHATPSALSRFPSAVLGEHDFRRPRIDSARQFRADSRIFTSSFNSRIEACERPSAEAANRRRPPRTPIQHQCPRTASASAMRMRAASSSCISDAARHRAASRHRRSSANCALPRDREVWSLAQAALSVGLTVDWSRLSRSARGDPPQSAHGNKGAEQPRIHSFPGRLFMINEIIK